MKKIIYMCGHFATGTKQFDGQTIKTRILFDQLVKRYGKKNVKIIDTYGWRKHSFRLFRECKKAARNASDIIIMPADKGTRVFVPLFVNLKKRNSFKLHHVLIGSELYILTERNKYLRNKAKKIDYIYAENHSLIKKLRNQGIKNVVYMPNFKVLKKVRKVSGIHHKNLHTCIFSRIEEEKGIIDAIDVMNKYNDNHEEKIFLDIYGKIKDIFEKEFNSAIVGNKYIKYLGVVDQDDSVKTIKKYDLLLFPTRYKTEGIPGTIIDAYFAGLPVLSARWENFDEIITEGKTGISYNFGDVNDFYDKLSKIAQDKKILMEFKENCLSAAEKYTPENAMPILTGNIKMTDKKKIVLYIDSMHRGGAERVMSIIANHFADENDVVLVTDLPVVKNESNYTISKKVKCVCLQPKSKMFLLKNWQRIKELRRIVKVNNADIVLSFLREQNYRMILATMGLKCKKCVSVRNDPNREYGSSWVNKKIANKIFGFADECVFQTNDAKRYFSKKIQKKSVIIANPIDEKFFKVKRAKQPKNIITVGRLEPQKNHKLLIESFARISDRIPDEKLLIYGDGSLRNELQKYIDELGLHDRVLLMGKFCDIEKELAKARLFVLSSDYEGMPNALMEAMAAGVPCVSTDCPCGGPRKLFCDKNSNNLVSCSDAKKMSEAMYKVMKENDLNVEVKKNCGTIVYYCTEKIMQKWGRLFTDEESVV
ncbi:MAG: glycosyltransferase [Candidatus Saccharibacteria bacterium]|nr:glycosyltransferase [Candidatus Saccharibacteria bacterium]